MYTYISAFYSSLSKYKGIEIVWDICILFINEVHLVSVVDGSLFL